MNEKLKSRQTLHTIPLTKKPITILDRQFAQREANRINKAFPGVAKVIEGVCYLKQDYYDDCCSHVQENCEIK